MPAAFQVLKSAMDVGPVTGPKQRWGELMAELWPVISSPLTWEGERLLLEAVRFEGQLRLVESSELPHSMPPEDMLKSLAIQALARWTGLAHLHEMQRVQVTTLSSSLSSLVSDVIQKARESYLAARRSTELAESSPGDAFGTTPLLLETDRGMSFVPGRRAQVHYRAIVEAVC
jgi:hypothetical protein